MRGRREPRAEVPLATAMGAPCRTEVTARARLGSAQGATLSTLRTRQSATPPTRAVRRVVRTRVSAPVVAGATGTNAPTRATSGRHAPAVSPEPLRAPSPRPRTHHALFKVEEQGEEHRSTAGAPPGHWAALGAVGRKNRGEKRRRATWVRPVCRGPKRRERGVGQEHQPAVSRSRPRPAPPPRTLAAGPSPARSQGPRAPAQQQTSSRARPFWAEPPSRRGLPPPPLAAAWAGLRPKPRICLPAPFSFLFPSL